jgi:hypothetical protein
MDWNTLISTVISTFVGAYVAFLLERRTRVAEETSARSTAGNLALLTLSQMLSQLRRFQEDFISSVPDRSGRWLKMRVTFPRSGSGLGFDVSRLEFLLESEDKNLLPELLLEEQRFQLVFEMINTRSHLMLEKVHPSLSAGGIHHGQEVDERAARSILGPALSAEADELTEQVVAHVNESVQSQRAMVDKLHRALVTLVPGQKFIRVDFDKPAPTPNAGS